MGNKIGRHWTRHSTYLTLIHSSKHQNTEPGNERRQAAFCYLLLCIFFEFTRLKGSQSVMKQGIRRYQVGYTGVEWWDLDFVWLVSCGETIAEDLRTDLPKNSPRWENASVGFLQGPYPGSNTYTLGLYYALPSWDDWDPPIGVCKESARPDISEVTPYITVELTLRPQIPVSHPMSLMLETPLSLALLLHGCSLCPTVLNHPLISPLSLPVHIPTIITVGFPALHMDFLVDHDGIGFILVTRDRVQFRCAIERFICVDAAGMAGRVVARTEPVGSEVLRITPARGCAVAVLRSAWSAEEDQDKGTEGWDAGGDDDDIHFDTAVSVSKPIIAVDDGNGELDRTYPPHINNSIVVPRNHQYSSARLNACAGEDKHVMSICPLTVIGIFEVFTAAHIPALFGHE